MSHSDEKPLSKTDHGEHCEKRSSPSDESFRLLVESVTDYAIFLLSCDGRGETWNAGAD